MSVANAALLCCSVFLVILSFSLVFFLYTLRLPLYHPNILFSAYFAVGYVLAAISMWWNHWAYLWTVTGLYPDGSDVLYAGTLATLGYLSFTYGPLFLMASKNVQFQIAPLKLVVGAPFRFWLTFTIFTILGIAAFKTAFFFSSTLSVTNPEIMVDAHGGQRLVGISGYEMLPHSFLPVLVVVLFLVLRNINLALFPWCAYLAATMFVGENRSSFIAATFGVITVVMFRKGIRFIRLHHLAVLLILAVIFDWLGTNRMAIRELIFPRQTAATDLTTQSDSYAEYLEARRSEPLSDTYDFDSLVMVSKIVPDLTGFNWGSQYVAGLIWPIPRQLWPDKPVFTGRINFLSIGNFFGQTISSMGDAYSNFGMASLVLFMGALGMLSSKLYEAAATTRSPSMIMLFVIYVMYTPILFRSSIVQFEYFLLASIFCVSILFRIGKVQMVARSPG